MRGYTRETQEGISRKRKKFLKIIHEKNALCTVVSLVLRPRSVFLRTSTLWIKREEGGSASLI